jgi:hypothetical protein
VRSDLLGRRCRGLGLLAEQHLEDRQAELPVVRVEPLGLLPHETELQLLVLLAQQQEELLVLVALRLDARDALAQCRKLFLVLHRPLTDGPCRIRRHGPSRSGHHSTCQARIY